jgi:V8-like Glu-specific endopeptidase
MVDLDVGDRQQLVGLLQDTQPMQTESARREILIFAGLDRLVPLIDVSGAPFLATNKIVNALAEYGRLTYENEALGLFLNAMKQVVGVQQQERIDALLIKYDMMEPIAPRAEPGDWKGTESPESVSEKIFGENTLRPIAFLARGLEVSRPVAYISVRSGAERWSGTGFLVAPDLAMTNHHVISDAGLLPGVILRFNYQEDWGRRALPTREYQAKSGGLFHANQTLDYAIFQVEGEPGEEWGWLPLQSRDIRTDERINIVQHPNGQPKQITLQNNFVAFVGGNVVQYVTSTNPGSSGSPVFNDGWEVVALHHAGGRIPEPTTGRYYNRNEGILLSRILADLPGALRDRIEAAT